ncbi:peptidoglycan-binding domain-containing protein [Listeria booriae]|uniref:peptidoglycan-binding domain-containing protein n=1 Tax=Listeria booriae TaxID=1552123 RepID=UPI001C8A6957|nr:peptidoglycan-binding domain-containing protein [Listeria booriae]
MKKIFASIMMVAVLSGSFVGVSGILNEQKVEAKSYRYGGVWFEESYTKQIQRSLNNYYKYVYVGGKFVRIQGVGPMTAEDGIYGSQTGTMVRSFQSSNGLVADGICGTKTWTKLSFWYF